MRLSDSKHMRDADATAIHLMGIPGTLLMTNAASHVARAAMELMGARRSAFIFCGSGNNGGDGIGAALYLLRRGIKVKTLLVGSREKMTPDTSEMERRLIELGGTLEEFDPDSTAPIEELDSAGVIIDAIFGTGLRSPVSGAALEAVRIINKSRAPVVSADIASGIHADTGSVLGQAVYADVTVTFSMAKPGHFVEPGCSYCGDLKVAGIGLPEKLLLDAGCGAFAVTEQDCRLPRRPRISHKGMFGKLLIIGGSVGYTGAPSLCAKAAVRSGAGLTWLGVPGSIYDITAVKNDEAMPFPLAGDDGGRISLSALPVIEEKLSMCGVCAVGPGLGRSGGLCELVSLLVKTASVPLLLDADGINALSDSPEILKQAAAPVILTPHEGEFVRIGGVLTGDRIKDARGFAQEYGCVLVLKGHRTLCAFPDGEVYISTTGNPGMAKGGSGDVLTGIMGALLGQLPLKEAVNTAVWIHGRAGDICAEKLGEYSMTPTDIIGALPAALTQITD